MRQQQFLDVTAPDAARARWREALRLDPRPAEEVALEAALGRVLARDVLAPGDVPAFDRANVDGYAVRAADTYGATEREPALLRPAGPGVEAGRASDRTVGPGEAVPIATGGALPRGADAVVMVEDTDPQGDTALRVTRPVAPGAHLSVAGSDVAQGETVLYAGTLLTARETGTLAACGLSRVTCAGRVRVAVISTGDEIVPPGTPLRPGQVHDANATLLADAARELGCEATVLGIAPDETGAIRALLLDALERHDVVLLSGGTSKGGGDLSYRVLGETARIVVHGVALKPGKPLCLAAWKGKPVAVLPGFPTSAIFTFHAFVAPVLRRLAGRGPSAAETIVARLPRPLASEPGREEYALVSLVRGRDGLLAFPLGKGSGSVTTFSRADGFVRVPAEVERVEAGEEVEVTGMGRGVAPADLVVVGSHCTGLDLLLSALAARGLAVKVVHAGSRGGLEAARQGACDVAPVHLYDRATGRYNEPFLPSGARLLGGYGRRQGLAYASRLEERLGPTGEAEGAREALSRAAADPALRMAHRSPASGTYALVEDLLGEDGPRPAGWHDAYPSHRGVAAAIAQGRADWGVCLKQVAEASGLGWRPLREERYDFLVPSERWDAPGVTAFRALLAEDAARDRLRGEGFLA